MLKHKTACCSANNLYVMQRLKPYSDGSLHRIPPHLYRASWLHWGLEKTWSYLHMESTSAKTINKILHVTKNPQNTRFLCTCIFLAKAVPLWKNWDEEGKVSFLSLYQGKENLAFTCCFSPRSAVPVDLWAGHRTWCRKQHCSSVPLNHLFSVWNLTSLSTLTVTLKNGPLTSTDYNLICAPPPTEHLVLKQGWLCFFKSLSHFILQIKKLRHRMHQIHPLQLLCI